MNGILKLLIFVLAAIYFLVDVIFMTLVRPIADRIATHWLVIVERLFSVTRDRLISVPAFAWTYGRYVQAKKWLESLWTWQIAWRWRCLARYAVGSFVQGVRTSQGQPRVSFERR